MINISILVFNEQQKNIGKVGWQNEKFAFLKTLL
jgi:hypothetical protein